MSKEELHNQALHSVKKLKEAIQPFLTIPGDIISLRKKATDLKKKLEAYLAAANGEGDRAVQKQKAVTAMIKYVDKFIVLKTATAKEKTELSTVCDEIQSFENTYQKIINDNPQALSGFFSTRVRDYDAEINGLCADLAKLNSTLEPASNRNKQNTFLNGSPNTTDILLSALTTLYTQIDAYQNFHLHQNLVVQFLITLRKNSKTSMVLTY